VVLDVPDRFAADDFSGSGGSGAVAAETGGGGTAAATQTATRTERQRPSFAITLFSVLLPVALMMGKALADIIIDDKTNAVRQVFDILGRPLMALLIAVIVGIFTLGRGAAMTRDQITKCLETSLPPVAGIIMIVAAGGGFKQVLVDTGIGTKLAEWATAAHISAILLAWVLAVLIRLATGSATVATITASSLMLGLAEGMSHGTGFLDGARRRLGLAVLLARQRCRLLAGEGVLRDERRSDHQVVVDHGDCSVGHRPDPGNAAEPCDLTPISA
jgi:GntP family gluconate:H+ symporter